MSNRLDLVIYSLTVSMRQEATVFSYVDKRIREQLKHDRRLVTIDRQGMPIQESGKAPFISVLGPIPLPRLVDGREVVLAWYPFVRRVELGKVLAAAEAASNGHGEMFRDLLQGTMSVNSVLAAPGFLEKKEPLVRIHSCCMTGDVFGSMRCECGPQLGDAFRRVVEDGGGAVVYMSGHEGRGIGLWAKAVTYLLQDDGQDTYQANVSLGLPEDSRDFTDAGVVLRYLLKGRPVRLLSNNPLKREHLEEAGQPVSAMVPLVTGVCRHNLRYLHAKKAKGHQIPDL